VKMFRLALVVSIAVFVSGFADAKPCVDPVLSPKSRASRAHLHDVDTGTFPADHPGVVYLTHHYNSLNCSFDQVLVDPTVVPGTATRWGG